MNNKQMKLLATIFVLAVASGAFAFVYCDDEYDAYADDTVAVIGSTEYTSLAAAVDAVPESTETTITIVKDISGISTVNIPSGKKIILDLNGHSIESGVESAGRNYYAIYNYGNLTIRDSNSTIEHQRTLGTDYAFMNSDGSLTKDNVTIYGGYIWARGIENQAGGIMTIEAGTFVSCNSNGGAAVWNDSDLTIKGGIFRTAYVGSSSDQYGPGCINNSGDATSLKIIKGEFLSPNKRTYAIISDAKLLIDPIAEDDIIVTGAHGGLAIDSGHATVGGGKYTSTEYYGLYVSNDGTGTPGDAQVTVNGGTFKGNTQSVHIGSDVQITVESMIQIYGGTYENPLKVEDKVTSSGITIYGGTFKEKDPSEYLAEGYVAKETSQGSKIWVVSPIVYTITFDSNGGSTVSPQPVESGKTAVKPSDPTKDGSIFKGWYTDSALTTEYDFATKVTSSFTLYAKWEETPATLYTVTFMDDVTVLYSTQVEENTMVSKPNEPAKTGYRFSGWFIENKGTTKFDFTTKITADTKLYAGWAQICYVSVPESVEGVFTTTKAGNNTVNVSEGSFSFEVIAADGYTLSVYAGDDTEPLTPSVNTYTVTDLSKNVTIYIEALKGSEWTQASESYIENDDGSVTETKTNTLSNIDTKVSEISESATVKDSSGAEVSTSTSTATVTETAATVNVTTTSSEEATVTESFVIAVTEALEEGTTISVDVIVETPKVNVPKSLLTDEKITDVTVVVNNGSSNSATITIPKTAIASGDMADTISVSVTDGTVTPSASAFEGSSATASFDLNLEGTNTTVFKTDVSVAYNVALPDGADNIRAYCIDEGRFYDATYSNGTVYFDAPHFSTWVIVYDDPEDEKVIVEDEDDILFILEQQRKAREAASAQTTTGDDSGEEAAVIIAAAAVAGAMLACAFFAFRRP